MANGRMVEYSPIARNRRNSGISSPDLRETELADPADIVHQTKTAPDLGEAALSAVAEPPADTEDTPDQS